MFCVECGKETEIYKQGLCTNCYIQQQNFVHSPQVIDLIQCSTCLSWKYKNMWYAEPFEKILHRVLKDQLTISKEVEKPTISFSCDPVDNTIPCQLTVSGLINDTQINENHELMVRIKQTNCDVCSKQFGGYYEAILQLRPSSQKLSSKELIKLQTEVEELVSTAQQQGARTLFITDMGKEHGGLDFFLSDKSIALKIAKKIIEAHGGEFKQSSSLVGMKDGREVYRMTYLVRLPSYKTGDVIKFQKNVYYVEATSPNKIHLIELSTGNSIVVQPKEITNEFVYDDTSIKKEMIVVSQTKKEVQLMDKSTYKLYDIPKTQDKPIQTEVINVFMIDDNVYLSPENKHKE